jgi:hypothetical protein
MLFWNFIPLFEKGSVIRREYIYEETQAGDQSTWRMLA